LDAHGLLVRVCRQHQQSLQDSGMAECRFPLAHTGATLGVKTKRLYDEPEGDSAATQLNEGSIKHHAFRYLMVYFL